VSARKLQSNSKKMAAAPAATPTRLLPLSEAARQSGLGQTTLYRYLRQNLLTRHRGARQGRRGHPVTFVDMDQLERLLERFGATTAV